MCVLQAHLDQPCRVSVLPCILCSIAVSMAGALEGKAKQLEEATAPLAAQMLGLETQLKNSQRLCDLLQRDAIRQNEVRLPAKTQTGMMGLSARENAAGRKYIEMLSLRYAGLKLLR